eukprot:PITA_09682
MHSLISITGEVLSRKENYPKWSTKIKHTLILNELWKGVCEGEADNEPAKPTSNQEIAIWENKNSKAYALIATFVNEEVSRHISQFSNAFEALQKLKELNKIHMHDMKTTGVQIDIPLIAYVKALYPTYSNYLESLQASGNLNEITFESLRRSLLREKDFGKKTAPQSSEEYVCLAHKEKNPAQDSSRGRGGRRGRGKMNFRGRGDRQFQGENFDLHCIRCNRDGHDASTCKLPYDRIEQQRNESKDKSKLKPSGLGTIRLKLPGLPDILLHDVLYLLELRRNLLSLVHICYQGHSIHMFDGKVEVRKASDRSLVMTRIEEERLLKLQGTSSRAQNFSYNSHYDEGTFPSSLLWHARFGRLNYESLRMLKKNGVTGLPTIPRKLKQCDVCILVKHNKQSFHDSHSREHRKLELIHSDLCAPMPVPSANGDKYMMTFIDDYTRTCSVYLLKNKYDAFKTFKNFHAWIEIDA